MKPQHRTLAEKCHLFVSNEADHDFDSNLCARKVYISALMKFDELASFGIEPLFETKRLVNILTPKVLVPCYESLVQYFFFIGSNGNYESCVYGVRMRFNEELIVTVLGIPCEGLD